MVGINHITGGIAVTATMCSFSDINLFSRIEYLIICIIGSLISDIDNTRSILGKILLPISKYIAKNYGHRTITHSFLFIISTTLIVYFFEQFTLSNITLIFFYAIISHVVLDMLTIQGVPFLYPFSKLIFVIPGDAKMRIQNKNMKSQAIAFVVFSCFILFSYSLFQNGFWSTYNKSFSKVKHVHDEVLRSENAIYCKSDLGNGYVIESSQSKLLLYSDTLNKFFEIAETDKYKETTPIKTDKKLTFKEHIFVDIDTDSLNKIVKNTLIKEIKASSILKLEYLNKQKKQSNTISEEYCTNVFFTEQEDTNKSVLLEKIKIKEIRLLEEQTQNKLIEQSYFKKQQTYQKLKEKYGLANLEEKEQLFKTLKEAEQEAKQEKQVLHSTDILEEELRYLKEQLTNQQKNRITGFIKIITLIK